MLRHYLAILVIFGALLPAIFAGHVFFNPVRAYAPWAKAASSIAALAGPTAFLLVANFGVWIGSHGSHMYPATWDGLIACYFAALPFYRNSLVAGVVYTAALFGANQIHRRRHLGIASTVHAR